MLGCKEVILITICGCHGEGARRRPGSTRRRKSLRFVVVIIVVITIIFSEWHCVHVNVLVVVAVISTPVVASAERTPVSRKIIKILSICSLASYTYGLFWFLLDGEGVEGGL
jgi:hypothetical protein